MRVYSALFASFLMGNMPGLAATPAPPAEQAPADPSASVEALISRLSADSYQDRENASRDLWKMGEVVLEPLKQAAAGGDPEAAFRAGILIRNIEHFITPDTDPAVVTLVERYMRASQQDKPEIIADILKLRGWHQILKLYASEKDPLVLEELRPQAHDVAILGAREKIILGQPEEARKFLELAPRTPQSLLSLAAFHRANGTLEAEIKAAENGPADWRAALARAAGDTVKARAAAIEAGDETLAAAMALFEGDALPWLEYKKSAVANDPIRSVYHSIITDQWNGKEKHISVKSLAPLVRAITEGRDDESQTSAANALFLLGQVDLAEPTLSRVSHAEAAAYFMNFERIAEALQILGLDPQAPDYTGWVQKRFEVFLDSDRFDNERAGMLSENALRELLTLASLMDQFGLHAELSAAFESPLLAFAEDDEESFTAFLGQLFPSNRGRISAPLARNIAVKWAGDDEVRWETVIRLIFSDDDFGNQWWEWSKELDPKATLPQRLDSVLGLLDYTPDPAQLGRRMLEMAWNAVEKAPPGQKRAFLKRIEYVADLSRMLNGSGDAATALKVHDALDEKDREDITRSPHFNNLSAKDRWPEVVKVFEEMLKRTEENGQVSGRHSVHAFLAASLRRAGREKEAAVHDQWAERLSLGNWQSAAEVSKGYSFGGDSRRAAIWIARSAIEAPPQIAKYEEFLSTYATLLLEEGSWKPSAALAEAVAVSAGELRLQAAASSELLEFRLKADLARALSLLPTDRPRAIEMIARCHALFPNGGLLSDYFYPALNKAGLREELDKHFAASWNIYEDLIRQYPASDRLRNGAAWMASRAQRKLDEAENHSKAALKLNPDQPAYLDTLAEVHFAKGDRQAAVKYSAQAVNFAPGETMIRRQHERFMNDPLPRN